MQNDHMGPPHEALILGGESIERQNPENSSLESLRSPLPVEVMERLRLFEAQQAEAETSRSLRSLRMTANHLNPEETSSQAPSPSTASESPRPSQPPPLRPYNLTLPPSPISPISPPRQPLLPPRTLEPTHTPRWTAISDDPQTSLGRRVAAVMASPESNPLTPDQGLTETRRAIQSLIHRDLDHILSVSRQQRSELVQSFLENHRAELDPRLSRNPDSPSSLRPGPRRARNIRGDSRQNSGSRLSTLSNFSVQNLPTPTSTLSQQPLLFEEPMSYDSHPGPSQTHPEERMESIDEEDRSNLASPRTGPTVSSVWESMTRRLQRDTEYYQRRIIRYPEDVIPASNVIRLDADGDPIPFTESEARGHTSNHWPRFIDRDFQSNHSLNVARDHHQIVILPDGQEEIWPLESLPTSTADESSVFMGKTTPFCPDPLCLPLPCERPCRSGDVEVSRAACLIAR
ncbi:hypothetical protein V5O48_000651 [Marasmius crinis-equi]|uniref:Uncharacterized protein n=1 Tax=Marasmius crinis-equi TaxID=585013 RepID=A0ABR3G0M2_9AGAR